MVSLVVLSIILILWPSDVLAIQCNNDLFCTAEMFKQWEEMRSVANQLANLRDIVSRHGFLYVNLKNSTIKRLLDQRDKMCVDDTYTGFLLDPELDKSSLRCIWSGNSYRSACSPVSKKYSNEVFTYIDNIEWAKKISLFREMIGCDLGEWKPQPKVAYATELYICKQRCLQGGIGYSMSLAMMIAIFYTIFTACK